MVQRRAIRLERWLEVRYVVGRLQRRATRRQVSAARGVGSKTGLAFLKHHAVKSLQGQLDVVSFQNRVQFFRLRVFIIACRVCGARLFRNAPRSVAAMALVVRVALGTGLFGGIADFGSFLGLVEFPRAVGEVVVEVEDEQGVFEFNEEESRVVWIRRLVVARPRQFNPQVRVFVLFVEFRFDLRLRVLVRHVHHAQVSPQVFRLFHALNVHGHPRQAVFLFCSLAHDGAVTACRRSTAVRLEDLVVAVEGRVSGQEGERLIGKSGHSGVENLRTFGLLKRRNES